MEALEYSITSLQKQNYFFDREFKFHIGADANNDDIENQTPTAKKKPIKKILFIDDERVICNLFKTALEGYGYEVSVALNGKEGIRFYRENPIDLIITDIFMPEKDGHTLIHEIMEDFPEAKIIAISGYNSIYGIDTELDIAKSLGAKRVFAKPLKIIDLLKTIKDLE